MSFAWPKYPTSLLSATAVLGETVKEGCGGGEVKRCGPLGGEGGKSSDGGGGESRIWYERLLCSCCVSYEVQGSDSSKRNRGWGAEGRETPPVHPSHSGPSPSRTAPRPPPPPLLQLLVLVPAQPALIATKATRRKRRLTGLPTSAGTFARRSEQNVSVCISAAFSVFLVVVALVTKCTLIKCSSHGTSASVTANQPLRFFLCRKTTAIWC